MFCFEDLIDLGMQNAYSDLHVTGNHPLVYRKEGKIGFRKDIHLTHSEIDDLVASLLTPRELGILRQRLSVDLARSAHRIRARINVFSTSRGLSLAIRLLPGRVPTIESLNLHPTLREYCQLPSGLILICGSTGSGKSTTIAAMVDEINRTRAEHVITLEDPVEYRFGSRSSYVEQRELGTHMPSFAQGLLDVLREDPDIVVVGELREPETIRLTLNAVESGHLVIASLHATNSEDALYRICNSFQPEIQDLVRSQLSSTLALLAVQRLERWPEAGFRVPVLSILRGTSAIKGIIRDNRLSQVEGAIQTGRESGMMTQEQYRREFLGVKKEFIPPSRNFRPSEEESPDLIYQSPLVTNELVCQASTRKAAPPVRASQSQTPSSLPVSRDHDAYEIEDGLSMSEVIAELDVPPHPA